MINENNREVNNKIKKWIIYGKLIKKIWIYAGIFSVILLLLNVFSNSIIFFLGIGIIKFFNFIQIFSLVSFIISLSIYLFIQIMKIPKLKKELNKLNISNKEEEKKEMLDRKKQTVATNALNEQSTEIYFQINDLLQQPEDSGMYPYLEKAKNILSLAEKRYRKIENVLTRSDQINALKKILTTSSQSLDDIYNAVNKIINRVIIYEDDLPDRERHLHIEHVAKIIINMNAITEKMGDLINETLVYMEAKNVDASTLTIDSLIETLGNLHKKILEN